MTGSCRIEIERQGGAKYSVVAYIHLSHLRLLLCTGHVSFQRSSIKVRTIRRQIALSVELRSRASSRPEPSTRCCSSVPVALQLRRRASSFRRRHIPLNCWIHCWDSCLRHEDPANICSVLLSWSWLDAPLEAAIFRSNKLNAGILILSLIR